MWLLRVEPRLSCRHAQLACDATDHIIYNVFLIWRSKFNQYKKTKETTRSAWCETDIYKDALSVDT